MLPGYAGALTHGLIRTSHAIRALPTDGPPSSLMLDELAHGLALWAASFKILPGRPQLAGPLPVAEASRRLPRPEPPWALVEAGLFVHLDELEAFPLAVEALGPIEPTQDPLSTLSAQFCRLMMVHPDTLAVPLVHTVTPIAAVRTLRPYLPGASIDELYAHLWHVGAAITVAFTSETAHPIDPEVDPGSTDELLARAVTHQDPHVLKFSEACGREHTLNPDPIYLLAAQHVLAQLAGWQR